jgi:hypothetical protein
MANTLITPSVIAKEAVMALENNLVMANLVHRDFATEFQKVGATVTVRKPATFTATAFSTTVAAHNITESSVQVVLDKHYDITAEITSQQLSLDIADFSQQVLQPMMREHAQKVDANILSTVYSSIAGHTAVSSTPTLGDLANLMVQLDIQKVPVTERRAVLHPITYAKYAVLDPIANADKHGTPLTIKEYSIGRLLGADWYMDQNVPTWTSGIIDTAGALSGNASSGATAATVNALTDTQTVAAGDVFKIAGSDRGYLVLTGGAVSSNTVQITFSPPLDTSITTGAVVTFQDTHKANLAFHKNAFALVTAPLAAPVGGASYGTANYKGITCRVVMDYNMSTKVNQISVDILYGVKVLNKELAARLCD